MARPSSELRRTTVDPGRGGGAPRRARRPLVGPIDDQPDRIERTVLLGLPVAHAWTLLTEPAHLAVWLGDGRPAHLELEPGGRMEIRRPAGRWLTGRVQQATPPHAVTLLREHPSPFGSITRVEIRLAADARGTRLRLTETGRPAREYHDPAAQQARAEEWTNALTRLARSAARARGRPGPGIRATLAGARR